MSELKLLNTILAPHMTEKTMRLGSSTQAQYVFIVKMSATKKDIKEALKRFFKVNAQSVRIMRMKPKSCYSKGRPGKRKAFKKAYITLAEGQQIDLSQ